LYLIIIDDSQSTDVEESKDYLHQIASLLAGM